MEGEEVEALFKTMLASKLGKKKGDTQEERCMTAYRY
jgi:hypothetical protein